MGLQRGELEENWRKAKLLFLGSASEKQLTNPCWGSLTQEMAPHSLCCQAKSFGAFPDPSLLSHSTSSPQQVRLLALQTNLSFHTNRKMHRN